MPEFINNVSTLDVYSTAVQLGPAAGVSQVNFSVLNEPALAQFWKYTDESKSKFVLEDFERLFVQGTFGAYYTDVAGVRFRSAVVGSQAQIIAELSYKFDPKGSGGTLSTVTVTSQGQTTAQLLIPTVTLANFPPANPVDTQAVYVILPASFDPVGGKAMRWLCTYDAANAVWNVSGPDLYAEVQTSESGLASGVYSNLPTIGPTILLPRPGDYNILVGSGQASNGNIVAAHSYDFGLGASDADAAQSFISNGAAALTSVSRSRFHAGLGAVNVVSKYKATNGLTTFGNRFLQISPVRIT